MHFPALNRSSNFTRKPSKTKAHAVLYNVAKFYYYGCPDHYGYSCYHGSHALQTFAAGELLWIIARDPLTPSAEIYAELMASAMI